MIMVNRTSKRVAELSATLQPISEFSECFRLTEDMYMIAEDSNSYNSSFYCDGWVKPCFEGSFKGVIMQSVEDYQVLREYYMDTRLEGLAYDEIPEDWDDADAPDFPEMEITGSEEFRQIWINQQGETEVVELHPDWLDNGTYNVFAHSMQDWSFEPRHADHIKDIISECVYCDDEYDSSYIFSPCGELLAKYAPAFNRIVQLNHYTDNALRYFRSLRVAVRHHFALPTTEDDVRIYFDYLHMIKQEGRCMTEPRFVCPADLHAEHDRLANHRDELRRLEDIRKAEEAEAEFAENHAWLLGIEFDDEHFHYQSLDSVEAYRNEGDIMHHCIYRCQYYKKHDYLSMHISDHEDNRVATCTIDLKNRRIEQIQPISNDTGFFKTFGFVWKETNDYKHIWNTLMARMHTFPRKKLTETIQLKIA